MNRVRAMIVGVSRYDVSGWDTTGPARSAWAMAKWLLANGVDPVRIHLFMEPQDLPSGQDDLPDEQAELRLSGLVPLPTTHAEINGFWRGRLGDLATPGDSLFVSWSGHGMTDTASRRLMFCSDYTPNLATSVFNADEFLANLRGAVLGRFDRQLFLADTCGSYARFQTAPADLRPPARPEGVEQDAIFACADGKYALDPDGFGQFSGAMLQVLAGFDHRWPPSEELAASLREVVRDWPQKPFTASWTVGVEERSGVRAGGRDVLAREAITLVGRCDLGTTEVSRHYALTAANLGNTLPPSAGAELDIGELAAAGGQDRPADRASFGLLQFLTRVANDRAVGAESAEALRTWIADRSLEVERTDIARILERERGRRLLILRVDHDEQDALCGLEAYLHHSDFVAVSGFETRAFALTSWAELSEVTAELVRECARDRSVSALEVHFLVDPPLFHLPLNQIPLAPGRALGQRLACVAHSRERSLGGIFARLDEWETLSTALDRQRSEDLRFVEISLQAGVRRDEGIFWASFPVPVDRECTAQLDRLSEALSLGAPYLCWPHDELALPDPGLVGLLRRVVEARGLIGVPQALLDERIANPAAGRVTLLWDHPHFTPIGLMQGTT